MDNLLLELSEIENVNQYTIISLFINELKFVSMYLNFVVGKYY